MKTRNLIPALVLAAGTLMAGTAFAQDESAPAFAAVDTNGDGAVSYEEMVAVVPGITQEIFTQQDSDANGTLSEPEFETFDVSIYQSAGEGESDMDSEPAMAPAQ